MNMPNYYETLNVSRTASALEILASYNILKKMFGADPEMAAELDQAVAILRDETARAAYDRKMVEAMNKRAARSEVPMELPPIPETVAPVSLEKLVEFDRRDLQEREEMNKDFASKLLAIACSLAIMVGVGLALSSDSSVLKRLSFLSLDDVIEQEYTRPANMPEVTGYIPETQILENTGKSTLNIQNSKNESDVYLKLLSHKDGKVGVARHLFVKAGSDFTMDTLSPGKYEIQYIDLKIGKGGRSEVFEVTEGKNALGLDEFCRLSVRLKTEMNGTLPVEKVSLEEFNSVASL